MKKLIMTLALIICCQTANAQMRIQQSMYRIDIEDVMTNKDLSDTEKAEELALSAEQLIQLSGFMYAEEVLKMALVLDPNNNRAGFWNAFIQTTETFRGWYSRFKKLIAQRPAQETQGLYDELNKTKKHPSVYEFITENRPALKSEAEVQGFLDTHIAALDNLRSHLKNNRNKGLRIIVYKSTQALNSSGDFCDVTRTQSKSGNITYPVYSIHNCRVTGTLIAQLDRADYEALQHIVAGNQILFSVANAYRLDGAINSYDSSVYKSNKAKFETFFKNDSFGTLRSGSFMRVVESLGVDALAGYKQFVEQRRELCPHGVDKVDQRQGKLLSSGICVTGAEPNYMEIANLVDRSLKGQLIEVAVNKKQAWANYNYFNGQYETNWTKPQLKPVSLLDGSEKILYKTDVLAASPFLNPMQDLRTVAPTVWNKCDRAVELASADAGGMAPYRDSADVLKAMSADCE